MKIWILRTACVAAIVAAGAWAIRSSMEGRELDRQRASLARRTVERADLVEETRRLQAIQPSEAERAAIEAEEKAQRRMESELAELKRRAVERTARANSIPRPAQPAAPSGWVPIAAATDAGRATPVAAIQTVLWASAGGDVDRMADAIVLDPVARRKLEPFLASLPGEAKASFRTPEVFVATMTAVDVPPDAAFFTGPEDRETEDFIRIPLKLSTREGRLRESPISVVRQDGLWRLAVPGRVVDGYMQRIRPAAKP